MSFRSIDPRNIEVVDHGLAAVLRKKSPTERIEVILAANRTARMLARAGIRHQYPKWEEEQVESEIVRRVCGGAMNRPGLRKRLAATIREVLATRIG